MCPTYVDDVIRQGLPLLATMEGLEEGIVLVRLTQEDTSHRIVFSLDSLKKIFLVVLFSKVFFNHVGETLNRLQFKNFELVILLEVDFFSDAKK